MSQSSLSMNYGAFTWWKGIVTDIKHPDGNSGRVRVRIFGYHDQDEASIKDSDLPWSTVALPTTSAGLSGEGETHGLLVGSWVVGFFMDGKEGQVPVVMFSIAGMAHGDAGEWDIYNNEPDVNRLARHGTGTTAYEFDNKKANHINSVEGNVKSGTVPTPTINSGGFDNKVISRHGLSIELDGDKNNPRISIFHKSGSYIEFLKNGDLVVRVKGNMYNIVDGDVITKCKNMIINTGIMDIIASKGYELKTKYINAQTDAGELVMKGSKVLLKSGKSLLLAGSKVFIN